LLLGPSQLVPVNVIPENERWCAGAAYVPPTVTSDCSVGSSTSALPMLSPERGM
jgi:hypothetical protein